MLSLFLSILPLCAVYRQLWLLQPLLVPQMVESPSPIQTNVYQCIPIWHQYVAIIYSITGAYVNMHPYRAQHHRNQSKFGKSFQMKLTLDYIFRSNPRDPWEGRAWNMQISYSNCWNPFRHKHSSNMGRSYKTEVSREHVSLLLSAIWKPKFLKLLPVQLICSLNEDILFH